MSAMYRSERAVEAIHFGFDRSNFYVRVDFPSQPKWPAGAVLRVNVSQPTRCVVEVAPLERGRVQAILSSETGDGATRGAPIPLEAVAFREILEIRVPLGDLGWKPRQQAGFRVEMLAAGVELERHPEAELITVQIPDEEFESANWRI
jgi:hypothetical protein